MLSRLIKHLLFIILVASCHEKKIQFKTDLDNFELKGNVKMVEFFDNDSADEVRL